MIRVITKRYSFYVVADGDASYPVGGVLASPRDVACAANHLIGSEMTECLLAFFVNARQRVTGYAEVARGTVNATRFSPRDVLTRALHVGCVGFLLAHNHPSGEPEPSRADRLVTAQLRTAAQVVGLELLDHVIVAPGGRHFSFRDHEQWDVADSRNAEAE